MNTAWEVFAIVKSLDPDLNGNDNGFKVAAILLKGTETQNVYDLSKFFNYRLDFVKQVAYRLQDNKIWKYGKTRCNWFDEEIGFVEFLLDINIGLGFITKIQIKEE